MRYCFEDQDDIRMMRTNRFGEVGCAYVNADIADILQFHPGVRGEYAEQQKNLMRTAAGVAALAMEMEK